MNNNPEQHVLISGATGFMGSILIPFLADHGFFITALSMPSEQDKIGDTLKRGNISWLTGDFEETLDKGLDNLRHAEGYKSLIHLAGNSNVAWCEAHPEDAFHVNVNLTLKVLQKCGKTGLNHFLYPSTALVYGDYSEKAAVETDIPNPVSIYGITKLAAEYIIKAFLASTDVKVDILRIANVYGKKSHGRTVVGKIMEQALSGKNIHVSDPASIRDFVYETDIAEAFLKAIEYPPAGKCRIMNLSTGKGTRIAELINEIHNIMGLDFKQKNVSAETTSKLVLDNSLLVRELNWKPSVSIREGLKDILASLTAKR